MVHVFMPGSCGFLLWLLGRCLVVDGCWLHALWGFMKSFASGWLLLPGRCWLAVGGLGGWSGCRCGWVAHDCAHAQTPNSTQVGDGSMTRAFELAHLFLTAPRWEEAAMERAKTAFQSASKWVVEARCVGGSFCWCAV